MKRGFTLIEIIFVIVILGILSSIAAPKFMTEQTKGTPFEGAVKEITDRVKDGKSVEPSKSPEDTFIRGE